MNLAGRFQRFLITDGQLKLERSGDSKPAGRGSKR